MLVKEGFTNLVNMVGGFSGAKNLLGKVTEKGWAACGYPTETKAPAERTWATLAAKR